MNQLRCSLTLRDIKEALVDARQREDWRALEVRGTSAQRGPERSEDDYMTLLEYEDELRREMQNENIGKVILTARELGASDDYIVEKLTALYDLSKEEAEQRVRDYTP